MRSGRKIFALALALGLFIWLIDSLLDYLWFYEGTFWGLLITNVPPAELYMRLLILACFLGFGIVAAYMMRGMQTAREELEDHRQWLATTLSSIGDAVIATDRQGQITFMNPTAAGLTGWDSCEAQGRPLTEVFNIVNEHTLRRVGGPVEKVLATGATEELANHTLLVARDGRRRPIEDSAAPIKNRRGEMDGVVLVFRDVSHRRRVEEERARLDAQLRQSQKLEAIGTLAGGIAHDFNNILAVMMGYSELALRQLRQGRAEGEDLEQVLVAGQKAQSLVRQILAYSRRDQPTLAMMDLNLVVTDTAELLQRTLPKMITLKLNLEPSLETMQGNPVQLEQVLINLATNARDAMPQGGNLSIGTSRLELDAEAARGLGRLAGGPYLRLTVRDQGQGMDPATRQRIFEPFFTTKQVDQGTGLGLSTVYGIVQSLGGHITCESEPGRGTAFDLYFPVHQGAHKPPQPELSGEPVGGHERILVVDDDAAIRELGRRVLAEAGYQVEVAASGEEALERLEREGDGFDLVLLDVNMPGMGGKSCLSRLRVLAPKLKVVLASGYASQEVMAEVTAQGVQGFAAKPFLYDELLIAVRAALDQP